MGWCSRAGNVSAHERGIGPPPSRSAVQVPYLVPASVFLRTGAEQAFHAVCGRATESDG